jgi:hypothetical protein
MACSEMVNEVNCARKVLRWPIVSASWDDFSEQLPTNQVIALMRSSKRAAASWVVDGTNSYGRWGSTNGWNAAREYPMMDNNNVTELLVLLWMRWGVIGCSTNFGGEGAGKCCWWGGATDEQEIDGSPSKSGPVGQRRYLWNAESKVYKMGMGWDVDSTVKRYEVNFESQKYCWWR